MPTMQSATTTLRARVIATCWLALASAGLAVFFGACAADLREGAYTCAPDSAGACPPGWLCECRGAKCDWRCYSSALGSCGDDVLSPGEECDGEAISTQYRCTVGHSYCRSDCTVACTQCGNGETESTPAGAELCDDGNLLSHDGCSSTCLPEEPTWRQLGPRGDVPGARTDFAMAYDAARGRMVMFGGINNVRDPTRYLDDTWEWDGKAWLQVSVNSGPSARGGHTMAYDAGRRKVVLLGGYGRESVNDSATIWEWDGTRWQRISALSPGPRSIGRAVYDARRERIVLLGEEYHVWEWDGGRRTWTELIPAGATPTSSSFSGALTYDPVRGRVILYGGGGGDLWEWDGTARNWAYIKPATAAPTPSGVASMFYDLAQQRVVVVSTFDEIWTWDGGTGVWARAPLTGSPPEPRVKFLMEYSPSNRAAVLFGGLDYGSTWLWNGTAWTRGQTIFPLPPAGGALAYDPTQARILAVKTGATVETWEWKGQIWTPLVSSGVTPSGFGPKEVAFDPRRQRLFGFSYSANEAWEWNGTRWGMLARAPATFAYAGAVLYSPVDRRIHVFGNSRNSVDQVKWDGTQWQGGAVSSGLRLWAAFSVDPVRERIVRFSGFDGGFTRPDTWELGASWNQRTPGQSPRPMDDGIMTYDLGRRRSILLGSGQTWEWDGEDWSDITPPGYGPSSAANLTYDSSQQAIVTVGGGGNVWRFRYEAPQSPGENCHSGSDVDRDGLVGCVDPDCWAFCSPFCPPGQVCDAADPHCGDGVCSAALETCQACPTDCGVCPSVCGDYECTVGESALSCPGDCH
jgi:cysteine-rich repeat protein